MSDSGMKAVDAMTKGEMLEELRGLNVQGVNNKTRKADLVTILTETRLKMQMSPEIFEEAGEEVAAEHPVEAPLSVTSIEKSDIAPVEVAPQPDILSVEPEKPVVEHEVPIAESEVTVSVTEELAEPSESAVSTPVSASSPIPEPASIIPVLAVSKRSASADTLSEVRHSEHEEIQAWLDREGFSGLKKTFEDEELKEWGTVRELKFDHLRAMGITVGTGLKLLKCLKGKFEASETSTFQFDDMRNVLEDMIVTSLKTKTESSLPKPPRKDSKIMPPPAAVKATPNPKLNLVHKKA
ncbi:hypothetical protein HDU67_002844, partial [Dinochytrium kinnereticum]